MQREEHFQLRVSSQEASFQALLQLNSTRALGLINITVLTLPEILWQRPVMITVLS